jgi:hypothetical protein
MAPVSSREAGVQVTVRNTMDVCTFVDGLDRLVAGELLVHADDASGVVFVERGRICWAAARGLARRLTELLLDRAPGIDAANLEDVFRDCHARSVPLGETLVERGIVSADDLRSALLVHTAESLTALCRRESRMAWHARSGPGYSPRFTFTTTELLAESLGTLANRQMLREIFGGTGEWGASFVRGGAALPELVAVQGALPETVASVLGVGKWAASTLDVASTFQDEDALVTSLDGDTVLVAWRGPERSIIAGRMQPHGPARILNRRAQARRASE